MAPLSRRLFAVVLIFQMCYQTSIYGTPLSSHAALGDVVHKADISYSLRELGRLAAAWVRASFQSETLPRQAFLIFGEIGTVLGTTAQFVATNWEVISASLVQARAIIYGVPATAEFLLGSAGRVAASAAPTVLLALTVAGLIPPAVFHLRMVALETNGRNEARLWQMDRQVYLDIFRGGRRERDHIRLPSFTNTADILVPGPSADRVSEGPIQNYINAAFVARANPTNANRERAQTLLNLISSVAAEPRHDSEWND